MTTPTAKAFVGWLHEWRTSCFTVVAEEVRFIRQSSWKQWSGATTWVIGITAGYARPLAECLRQRSAADITRIRQANLRLTQWNKYPLCCASWIFIPLYCCSKFLSEMCKAILTISFLCCLSYYNGHFFRICPPLQENFNKKCALVFWTARAHTYLWIWDLRE